MEALFVEALVYLNAPSTLEQIHQAIQNLNGGRYSGSKYKKLLEEIEEDILLFDHMVLRNHVVSYDDGKYTCVPMNKHKSSKKRIDLSKL